MRDLEIGRLLRTLRRRRGWRQSDCAARARVHRSTWSALERGNLDGLSVPTLRQCLAAVETRLELVPRWRGSAADRLLDEDHAALQAAWAERLRRWGHEIRVEVSFNRYGDRGRIDLLAFEPRHRILHVGEVKTEIVDAQALLGALDVKVRVGAHVAASLGWERPRRVAPLLIVRDSSTTRDRMRRLAPLFSDFTVRGRAAVSCLRHPETAGAPLLILSDLRSAHEGSVMRIGRQRVRLRRPPASVSGTPGGAVPGRRPR